MSDHWPYIAAAYGTFFALFGYDWCSSLFEMRRLRRDISARARRDHVAATAQGVSSSTRPDAPAGVSAPDTHAGKAHE
jgi:hypothetical protein